MAAAVALTAAGCGDDGPHPTRTTAPPAAADRKAPATHDAHDADVRRAVARHVRRETHRGVELATGAYVDPRAGRPTRVACRPRSRTRLACVVDGYGLPGFSKFAADQAHGPFRWRWDVVVDGATGGFRARPVARDMPGADG